MESSSPITDLYDEVATALPGATITVIRQTVIAMLREFFVQSGAWVKEVAPVSIKKDVDTYYLDPQPDSSILYIHGLAFPSGDRYKFLTALTETGFRKRVNAPSAVPIAYHGYVDQPGKFTLTPVVTVDIPNALYPYVALTLPDTNCKVTKDVVPSWMFRYWKDHWLDGVISKLMIQQDKPYTNLLQAQYHARRFRNGMAQARDMARRQFTNAESDFQYPGWA